jgi:hypothetical protein
MLLFSLDKTYVPMNTSHDDPTRTPRAARRTGGIENFAETGMGKPPGGPVKTRAYPKRAQKLGVGLDNFVGVGSICPKGR